MAIPITTKYYRHLRLLGATISDGGAPMPGVNAGSRRLSGKTINRDGNLAGPGGVGLFLPTTFTGRSRLPYLGRLIQGNSSPEEVLSEGGKQLILKRYIKLTRRAVTDEPQVKLVVWPETVVESGRPGPSS